jgi:hypothetical protein
MDTPPLVTGLPPASPTVSPRSRMTLPLIFFILMMDIVGLMVLSPVARFSSSAARRSSPHP